MLRTTWRWRLGTRSGAGIWRRSACRSLRLASALDLSTDNDILIYIGRFFLAPGCVGLLDRLLADHGKLREFRTREKIAAEQAARAAARSLEGELAVSGGSRSKKTLLTTRMQAVTLKDGNRVTAPWQFRNCAMGGRHTEKEYPESNISMQESMFMPLSPRPTKTPRK